MVLLSEFLNQVSTMVIAIAGREIILSSILWIIVFLLTWLFKKANPYLHYALWSLILIRLVLPPDLSFSLSMRNLVDKVLFGAAQRVVSYNQNPSDNETRSTGRLVGNELQVHSNHASYPVADVSDNSTKLVVSKLFPANFPWEITLFLSWLLGLVGFSIFLLRRSLYYRKLVTTAVPVREALIVELGQKWRQLMKIKRTVKIVTSDDFLTPFTLGIFRPVIFIPQKLLKNFEVSIIDAVVGHEMAHIRHYDIFWMNLQNVIQLLYFFHPVVWFATSRINQAREQICDQKVLTCGISPKTYGKSMLVTLKMNLLGTDNLAFLLNFGNHKKRFTMRLQHIMQNPGVNRKSYLFFWGAAIVFGIFLLPMAKSESTAPEPITGSVMDQAGFDPGTGKHRSVQPEQPLAHQNSPKDSITNPNIKSFTIIAPVKDGYISAPFGKGMDPFEKKLRQHQGIDIAAPKGTPVHAAADGTVEKVELNYTPNEGDGRLVIINHHNDFVTLYAKLDTILVKEGQKVNQWDIIGLVGSTGRSTGPHLHFELRQNDQPINPSKYIIKKINDTTVNFTRPILDGRISSRYGNQEDPFLNKTGFHNGIDIVASKGTKIYAPADGIIEVAENDYQVNHGFGKQVIIRHDRIYSTRFAHLDSILVQKGQTVQQGDVIGLVGKTGRATWPHLHFEIIKNGKPVNPEKYIQEWEK